MEYIKAGNKGVKGEIPTKGRKHSSIGNHGGGITDAKTSVSVGDNIELFQKFFSSTEYQRFIKLGKKMREKFIRLVNES